jgi:DNA-binding IclR family transcriptional regulator
MDKVLGLLENGGWLDLKHVAEESELSEFETEKILNFLSRFSFIDLDEKGKRAKLTPAMLKFLKSIRRIEEGQGPT